LAHDGPWKDGPQFIPSSEALTKLVFGHELCRGLR
jgi:hypothetical protein